MQSIFFSAATVLVLGTTVLLLFIGSTGVGVFRYQSIFDHVICGPKLFGRISKNQQAALIGGALRGASLWDDVKDKLDRSALGLSG